MADESERAARWRRLRWLTLAEILGVAALVISALTLWNNYAERRQAELSKGAEIRQANARAHRLVLRARPDRQGERLALGAADDDQMIQSQTIMFPKALGIEPVDSTDPRIEARWFADGLKRALDDAGEKARRRGDARLPVAITTRYAVDGDLAEDVSLYDIGYVADSSFFGGTSIRLRGLSLIGHVGARTAPARLDALWKTRHQGAR
jgi:hypothetical protein